MRVLVQRTNHARVTVQSKTIGEINRGLLLFVGIAATDTTAELDWMVQKCLSLRLFPKGESDSWGASVQDIGGELLVVSQFTLYGNCHKGRRPSFVQAAAPEQAERLFNQFVDQLRASQLKIQTGQFGAHMQVALENNGPVTLWLERTASST